MEKLQPATVIRRPNDIVKQLFGDRFDADLQECWKNDTYTVYVTRHEECKGVTDENGKPELITWLSIKRNDRAAKPDWRDFQWIKNQLVGEECEGVELFPAESRLVDGSNQYHIWVFENPEFRFPFGFMGERTVTEKSFFGETQRKFPYLRRPKDLEATEKRITEQLEKIKQEKYGNSKLSDAAGNAAPEKR